MGDAARWIGRDEALTRLGVKSQTLYAYVSRRRIAARPDPQNPRCSLYAAADIDRLTGTETDAVACVILPFDVAPARAQTVASTLTTMRDGRLFYRGQDVVNWAQTATLEDTARLLWNGCETNPFAGLGPRLDQLPGLTPRARLYAALARRANEDRSATGRDPSALRVEAASVLNEGIDAVAGLGPRLYLHQRLGKGWKVLERDHHPIRHALVLAADHEVDAAVLAARVAAGGGASPAAAAMAGLATLAHGPCVQAIGEATAYVHQARRDPNGAATRGLAVDGHVPGFGDRRWPQGDPRAAALIAGSDLPADLTAIVREGEGVSEQSATLALALALVARKLDLPREGAADLYVMGRLVGLLGHALDQVTDGSPIAARLRYVGPAPGET